MWLSAENSEIKEVLKKNLDEENGVFCGIPHFTIYSNGLKELKIDYKERGPSKYIFELNQYVQKMLSKKNLDDADILGILLGIEIESIPCQIQLENFAISYAASQGLSSVYDKGFLKLFFKIHMHDGGEARHLEEAYRILEILKDKEKINKAERIADEITDFFKMWRLSYAEKLDYKKAGNF